MDSTDDGFHSQYSHEIEESLRQSLQCREQELKACSDHLYLSIPSLGKTSREKLYKYSKNLSEKGLTEVSRAHIIECHARQVLKQDDMLSLKSDLNHRLSRFGQMSEVANEMKTLYKKAKRSFRYETEKNKKNLETIQPFFFRHDDCINESDTSERINLLKRASSAVKKLSERKPKQQEDLNRIPPSATVADILSELEAKTRELEKLNKQLE